MAQDYDTFRMIWADRVIVVSHRGDWLGSGDWHIELRCDGSLPVTYTGYRSLFVPQASFADEAEIIVFITALLDETATSKAWQAYLAASQQLKLF